MHIRLGWDENGGKEIVFFKITFTVEMVITKIILGNNK